MYLLFFAGISEQSDQKKQFICPFAILLNKAFSR